MPPEASMSVSRRRYRRAARRQGARWVLIFRVPASWYLVVQYLERITARNVPPQVLDVCVACGGIAGWPLFLGRDDTDACTGSILVRFFLLISSDSQETISISAHSQFPHQYSKAWCAPRSRWMIRERYWASIWNYLQIGGPTWGTELYPIKQCQQTIIVKRIGAVRKKKQITTYGLHRRRTIPEQTAHLEILKWNNKTK